MAASLSRSVEAAATIFGGRGLGSCFAEKSTRAAFQCRGINTSRLGNELVVEEQRERTEHWRKKRGEKLGFGTRGNQEEGSTTLRDLSVLLSFVHSSLVSF